MTKNLQILKPLMIMTSLKKEIEKEVKNIESVIKNKKLIKLEIIVPLKSNKEEVDITFKYINNDRDYREVFTVDKEAVFYFKSNLEDLLNKIVVFWLKKKNYFLHSIENDEELKITIRKNLHNW